MKGSDFSLRALYDALDAERNARGITWAELTRQVSRFHTWARPVASSTIVGLKTKRVGEGDGILQMLLWLGRTPESFVPGIDRADAERFRLPEVGPGEVLRWNTRALHAALNARRQSLGLTWQEVALEVGGYTPAMLTRLAAGGRTGFPHVMRLVRWLGEPAATFTWIGSW